MGWPLDLQAWVHLAGIDRQALQVGPQAGPITLPRRQLKLGAAALR